MLNHFNCFLLGTFHAHNTRPELRTEEAESIILYFFSPWKLVEEGNGTPLQYSCLENPMDGGAWWAAVYGLAQSRT